MREVFSLIKSPVYDAVTFETFWSLLKLINPQKYNHEKQVKLLFEIIDFDNSKLIGN